MHHCEYFFLIFMSLPFRLSVTKLVSYNLSVYLFVGTLVETKIPTYSTTTGIYLRHEAKQGRKESTTPIMPCILLAWLKIKKNVL